MPPIIMDCIPDIPMLFIADMPMPLIDDISDMPEPPIIWALTPEDPRPELMPIMEPVTSGEKLVPNMSDISTVEDESIPLMSAKPMLSVLDVEDVLDVEELSEDTSPAPGGGGGGADAETSVDEVEDVSVLDEMASSRAVSSSSLDESAEVKLEDEVAEELLSSS